MKSVMEKFGEKKKGHIFLISIIFHIKTRPCLLKNRYCELVLHHISILFVLHNAEGIKTHFHY